MPKREGKQVQNKQKIEERSWYKAAAEKKKKKYFDSAV